MWCHLWSHTDGPAEKVKQSESVTSSLPGENYNPRSPCLQSATWNLQLLKKTHQKVMQHLQPLSGTCWKLLSHLPFMWVLLHYSFTTRNYISSTRLLCNWWVNIIEDKEWNKPISWQKMCLAGFTLIDKMSSRFVNHVIGNRNSF